MGGFTLLEILVSLAIVAIAVTVVMQLYSADLKAVSVSGNTAAAAARGDSRIKEILADPSLSEKDWSEMTEDGYRIEVHIAEVLKERTDNLPVRLLEILVAVHWHEGWKDKSIQLKTLKMIDKIRLGKAGSPVPYSGKFMSGHINGAGSDEAFA